MKRYAIKKNKVDKVVAVLNYDEAEKTYTIDIPEGIGELEVPFLISAFLEKGIHHIDKEWSFKWVQSRIIPSSRQNIGEILRVNHMTAYDEHELLMKNQGRSCQDEFYLESM